MELAGKRVLATGATGLLGAATAELLTRRGDVNLRLFVRDRRKAEMFRDGPAEIVLGDITDSSSVDRAVAGCDVVIHSVMATGGDDARQVNIEGTRHVLDAALAHRVERLVHISSVAVYHPVSAGVVDENSPKEPDGSGTSYHDTKLESEKLALQYEREQALPVVALQPVAVYGPRAEAWTLGVLEQLRHNTVLLVDEATGYHNVVYVDDVARGMILAAEQDGAEGECFILSGKENILSRVFYGAYERMMGTQSLAVATAEELETLGGDLGALARQMGMPADRPAVRAGFEEGISYSHAKAHRVLGYEPQISFERGMQLTETWARASGLLG